MTHKGECFCGTVRIEVSGTPEAMGYCHCSSCRSWSGGPVNAFTLLEPQCRAGHSRCRTRWHLPEDGGERAEIFAGMRWSPSGQHPSWGVVDVFAATLPTLEFSPGVHVNYAETVLPMRDGLPKFKDFPAQFGGSDEQIVE